MTAVAYDRPITHVEPRDRKPGYVLEVEDEPETSLLDTRDYEEVGASRIATPSPEKARVEILKLGPLQDLQVNNVIVLLDLMFEPDNEIERACDLIREIRAGRSDVHHLTPIVVLTNNTAPTTKRRVLEAGANHFFRKTADPGHLLDLVRFYLGVESVVEQRVLEIDDIDYDTGEVTAVIRGEGEWEAVAQVSLAQCPWSAQVPGGSFVLERVRRFREFQAETVLRPRVGSAQDEGQMLLKELGE